MQYDDISDYGPVAAMVLVYSITSQRSFEFVSDQLRDMRTAADQTPAIVAANKTDLVRTRQVSEDSQLLFTSTNSALLSSTSPALSAVYSVSSAALRQHAPGI